MGQRVKGICYIKVDGTQLTLKSDSGMDIPINSTTKEAVMGLAGVAGYGETAQRPHIKGAFIFEPDFPISTLVNMTNGTITAELANGKVYTLAGAWMEGETLADGVGGEIPVEFSGTSGIWS